MQQRSWRVKRGIRLQKDHGFHLCALSWVSQRECCELAYERQGTEALRIESSSNHVSELRCESSGDFPGGPVIKTLPSNARDEGSKSSRGAKMPHAPGPKSQNIKQKQYCIKFNKNF